MSQRNLFEPVPEESLFGDPRDRFERLRGAVTAFFRDSAESPSVGNKNAEACDAIARLLLLYLDRKAGSKVPSTNSDTVMEVLVNNVIKAVTGRHLQPEEVFKD